VFLDSTKLTQKLALRVIETRHGDFGCCQLASEDMARYLESCWDGLMEKGFEFFEVVKSVV
jgi:hypothetical protein